MNLRIRPARTADVAWICRTEEETTPASDAAQEQYNRQRGDMDMAAFWGESIARPEEVVLVAEDVSDDRPVGFCWWSRYSAARAYVTGHAGAEEYSWDELRDPLVLQMIHEDRSHRQLFAPDTALLDLECIAVPPDAQRRGVGTLLVDAGRHLALRQERVHISVVGQDATFFQHRGFRTRTRSFINAAKITSIPDLRFWRQYYMTDTATEHNAIPAAHVAAR